MSSNAEMLRKADLAISDLSANGGLLQPEDSVRFIRTLIKQARLIREARVVEMNSPQRKINKIQFGSRILRKAVSSQALTEAQRSKPTTDVVSLSTKEQIAEVRLPYDVLEDNIERATAANNENPTTGPGGLRQTLIDLIAERASVDMEELAISGDTAYTNGGDQDDEDYISQLDGYLKRASTSGHAVEGGNVPVSKALFREGMKELPDQYLRTKAQMRHYVSVDTEIDYRDTLADRGTGLGDSMVTGAAPAMAYGVPVAPVEMMPDAKGLFCNPKNLIFGIQRQVSMEYDKDITARVYIIVLTARIDFQIEETDALVYYYNVGSA